jgi:hypothetical protein
MALIAPDSTGMPVHEPVHGRAGTTANSATHRNRDSPEDGPAAGTQPALPRLLVPRPDAPPSIPDHDTDELDAPAVRTCRPGSPGRPSSRHAPRKADRRILRSERLAFTEPTHPPSRQSAVVTVETAEQSASLASTPKAAMTGDRSRIEGVADM